MAKFEHFHSFTRRAFILGLGKSVLGLALIGRLYYLQFIKGRHYKNLAEENRLKLQFLSPQRGLILDVRGKPLCDNKTIFKAFMVPEEAENWRETLSQAQTYLHLSPQEVELTENQILRRPKFMPIDLKESLNWEEVSRLSLALPDLPGVHVEQGLRRHYPYTDEMAHVIGYVRRPAKGDQIERPYLQLSDFRMGKSGIEKVHDTSLRGKIGYEEVEVNAVNRPIRTISQTPPKSGRNQKLTLNYELQKFVSDELEEYKSASCVVINVKNGAIEAIVSKPSYDSNKFVEGIDHKSWAELLNDPHHPLTFKPLQGLYPPASTFKMVTLLAAFKKRAIDENYTVHCNGKFHLGSHTFHCWRKHGHGNVNPLNSIALSCDPFFYTLALKIGIDAIADMARDLGLGSVSSLGLPGEKSGLIPDREWKKKYLGQPWYRGETVNTGIGQGYTQATPLQLAIMTARLASGRKIEPTLDFEKAAESSLLSWNPIDCPPQHLELVRKGMMTAVYGERGTLRRFNKVIPRIAGKTGTAQVRRISKAEREAGVRKTHELPWHLRDHAMFVGFTTPENPQYAVSVIIDHGGWGSQTAAPEGVKILQAASKMGVKYNAI